MTVEQTVAQGMVRKRYQDGLARGQACDDAIARLEADEREFQADAEARNKKLVEAGESIEYIEAKMRNYGIQIDWIVRLRHAVRQLKKDDWDPATRG